MPLGADIVFGPERRRPGSPAIRQATGPTSSSACERRFRTSVTSSESTSPTRARLATPRTRDEPCTADARARDGVGSSGFSESRAGSENHGSARDVANMIARRLEEREPDRRGQLDNRALTRRTRFPYLRAGNRVHFRGYSPEAGPVCARGAGCASRFGCCGARVADRRLVHRGVWKQNPAVFQLEMGALSIG